MAVTATTPATTPPTDAPAGPDASVARVTGLLYLALGISGMLGFLLIRPQLFDAGDPAATAVNLLQQESLARAGIALELVLVITQVLVALWFYRLFRPVDPFTAGTVTVFGIMNGIAILASAAFLASALDVALQPVSEGASQLMYLVSENLWGVGNVFFGLWLIPMGVLAIRSGWTPRPLGWTLIAGGLGYVLLAFVHYLVPSAGPLAELLVVPATVAEFWMIGWLLFRGTRRG